MWRSVRQIIALAVVVACTIITIRIFDWTAIGSSLHSARLSVLLTAGFAVLFATFVIRGFRWLYVIGTPITLRTLALSISANGAAACLAILTPFQLGEAIKIRLASKHHDVAWKNGASGFFVERVLDLSSLAGIGLCGLSLHAGMPILAGAALTTPLFAGYSLCMVAAQVHRLPAKWHPFFQAFHHPRRIFIAAAATIPLWLLNTGLWWIAVKSMGISLTFSDTATLLGGVTLAILISLSPSGIGVSELGARGIMIWLGYNTQEAETTAIALRFLTPLILLAGSICALLMWRFNSRFAKKP